MNTASIENASISHVSLSTASTSYVSATYVSLSNISASQVSLFNNETFESANIETNLELTAPVHLTELENSEEHLPWCCNARLGKNIFRVAVAAILSSCGAWYAGFVPATYGVVIGSTLSGVGNGASTWLAWETKRKQLLAERLTVDFPKVAAKIEEIDGCISELSKVIFLSKVTANRNVEENLEIKLSESVSLAEKAIMPNKLLHTLHPARHFRNFLRLSLAGGLSGAGGALGGFLPTTGGIIGGGVLGGVGNGVSTWLAFEQTFDPVIRKVALKKLPHLLVKVNESEKRLINVIKRINRLDPHLLLNFNSPVVHMLRFEEDEDALMKRFCVNFWSVNVAGWMSFGGALLAGLYPKPAGIVVGSFFGAAANAISTWLAWNNKNDKIIENIALYDFPEWAQKNEFLSYKINDVEKFVIELEDAKEKLGKIQ